MLARQLQRDLGLRGAYGRRRHAGNLDVFMGRRHLRVHRTGFHGRRREAHRSRHEHLRRATVITCRRNVASETVRGALSEAIDEQTVHISAAEQVKTGRGRQPAVVRGAHSRSHRSRSHHRVASREVVQRRQVVLERGRTELDRRDHTVARRSRKTRATSRQSPRCERGLRSTSIDFATNATATTQRAPSRRSRLSRGDARVAPPAARRQHHRDQSGDGTSRRRGCAAPDSRRRRPPAPSVRARRTRRSPERSAPVLIAGPSDAAPTAAAGKRRLCPPAGAGPGGSGIVR